MIKSMIVAVLAVMAAAPVAAEDIAAQAPDKPVKEKRVCRSVTPTGSILSKPICLTKADWKTFQAQNQQQVDLIASRKISPLDRRAPGN